ncbi:MAG: HD-GYP domain-containing protein [bacterium]|jgi:HD-GYP domain-containing protein (c-di-GMP phosphodiesterase class II)|nr:HD domain-containing protein [Betaproteobacteria bacterium]
MSKTGPLPPSATPSPEGQRIGELRLLGDRLLEMHQQLAVFCPAVKRVAVGVHDPATGAVRTFLRSATQPDRLQGYERPLSEVPSLQAIARSREARVIDDLSALGSASDHTRWLVQAGYRSSLAFPLFAGETLLGFLFFDADHVAAFSVRVVGQLRVYSQLIAVLLAHELGRASTLLGAVRTALHFSRFRDDETTAHLLRMSHYAKLVATGLPESIRPDDEYVEFLLCFSPLHDIGKIGVPDEILHKPGKLTDAEWPAMRAHVRQGAALIDAMVEEFGLGDMPGVDMLRNIVLYHHENFDGSGYDTGLRGDDIPLEARIAKVADVFDALTSRRPYKEAWAPDDAFAWMASQSGAMFDPRCVDALLSRKPAVLDIMARFVDAD